MNCRGLCDIGEYRHHWLWRGAWPALKTVLPLMRPLTEQVPVLCQGRSVTLSVPLHMLVWQETKAVLEKLYKYIGKNIKSLIDRPDEPYCLRLHSNRVYYVRESLMRRATNVCAGGRLHVAFSTLRCCEADSCNTTGRTRAACIPGTMYRQAHTFWQVPPYHWSTWCSCCTCKV